MQSLSLHLLIVSGLKNEELHIGRIDLSPDELSTLGRIDLRAKRSDTSQASANREGSERFKASCPSLCSTLCLLSPLAFDRERPVLWNNLRMGLQH